jgi:hypothetical protein
MEARVLRVPEAETARVAAWLTMELVPDVEPGGHLTSFLLDLDQIRAVVVLVINGTKADARPQVLVGVIDRAAASR